MIRELGKLLIPSFPFSLVPLSSWLAAFGAEFSFVDCAALALPLVADGFGLAALGAEFPFVDCAALALPLVADGLGFAAL